MSLSTVSTNAGTERGFPLLLKTWRHKRRLSQLDLALSSGVSQRHVSFLESGRARPSRSMILQLSETLEVPLRERNDWLTAAGFAPIFKAAAARSSADAAGDERGSDDADQSRTVPCARRRSRLEHPHGECIVRTVERRCSAPDVWERIGGAQRNLMRLFFHPNGIRPFVANWNAIAPLLWQRAQKEADAFGGQEMQDVLSRRSRRCRTTACCGSPTTPRWCRCCRSTSRKTARASRCSPSSQRSARRRTSPPTNCASRASFRQTTPPSNSSAPRRDAGGDA